MTTTPTMIELKRKKNRKLCFIIALRFVYLPIKIYFDIIIKIYKKLEKQHHQQQL